MHYEAAPLVSSSVDGVWGIAYKNAAAGKETNEYVSDLFLSSFSCPFLRNTEVLNQMRTYVTHFTHPTPSNSLVLFFFFCSLLLWDWSSFELKKFGWYRKLGTQLRLPLSIGLLLLLFLLLLLVLSDMMDHLPLSEILYFFAAIFIYLLECETHDFTTWSHHYLFHHSSVMFWEYWDNWAYSFFLKAMWPRQ